MREVTRDSKWVEEDSDRELPGELIPTDANAGSRQPSETELVQVALLMRLYDLGMAILTSMDDDKANQVYEAHEKGGHFNPPIFIPDASANEN